MKFCTYTLGCKVNQFETQAIENMLIGRGHTLHKVGTGCDVCIINTCAVTAESGRKSRQAIRRIRLLEPNALMAVCGCYTQLDPNAAASIGADVIGGSGNRLRFADEVEKKAANADEWGSIIPETCHGPEDDNPKGGACESESTTGNLVVVGSPLEWTTFEELPPGATSGRTRALLKIQDGCDNFCTYCVVPHVRGRVRSLPINAAAAQARQLSAQGYKEIVITGIEISSYGKDLGGSGQNAATLTDDVGAKANASTLTGTVGAKANVATLTGVVRAIANAAPDARLRLGSLDPRVVTESFCRELQDVNNLCGHFHLSLQSGCDHTLRRMGRKYDTATVRNAVALLRRAFPDCGITADLITGFPGETAADFQTTLCFITDIGFSGMHIFPYSQRPGTPAAVMDGQVDKEIRQDRARIASIAAKEMALEFRRSQIGRTVSVLFERKRDGFWSGHSENYIEVSVKTGGSRNTVSDVLITEVSGDTAWGLIKDANH